MPLSRRAALAALTCGALAACTPPTRAELAGFGLPRTPDPLDPAPAPQFAPTPAETGSVVPSSSAAATTSAPPSANPTGPAEVSGDPSGLGAADRSAVIARYGTAKPTAWGLDIPGVTKRLPTADRVVALTFDACGGPSGSGYDQALVSVLRQHKVPATLFLNARWIDANPQAFAQLAADPLFEIGNHGTQHRPLSVTGRAAYRIPGTRNAGEVFDEVIGNRDKLTGLLGRTPRFFRTGTAFCDDVALRITGDLGQQMVNFEVNGDAGATRPAPEVDRALRSAKPGSIVICHMNRPGSGTAAGVASAVPALASAGFRFVRLSDYLT